MIEERYCSSEVSRLLREKGFDEACTRLYYNDDLEFVNDNVYGHVLRNSSIANKDFITAPTHQMACDWLREVHKIFIEISVSIDLNGDYHYRYSVLNKDCKYARKGYTSFDWNYTDAVEEALKYSLENLV